MNDLRKCCTDREWLGRSWKVRWAWVQDNPDWTRWELVRTYGDEYCRSRARILAGSAPDDCGLLLVDYYLRVPASKHWVRRSCRYHPLCLDTGRAIARSWFRPTPNSTQEIPRGPLLDWMLDWWGTRSKSRRP